MNIMNDIDKGILNHTSMYNVCFNNLIKKTK